MNQVNDYQENYGNGWIKLFRSIKTHWIYQNDKYFKWWITLLWEVNHNDKKISLGYKLYVIKKGQSAKSIRTWASLFNCGTKQVTNFFNLLEDDKMLKREILGKGKQSTTLITIENYEQYQTIEKRKANARQTQEAYKQEVNNYNNIYPSFEDFWNLYDKKNDRVKSEKKWDKLKQSVKEKIMLHIPQYKLSQPDKQFRKNPTTFLNNESWENEIIMKVESFEERTGMKPMI